MELFLHNAISTILHIQGLRNESASMIEREHCMDSMLVIITCQHARMDLFAFTPETIYEKDRLLSLSLPVQQLI